MRGDVCTVAPGQDISLQQMSADGITARQLFDGRLMFASAAGALTCPALEKLEISASVS